MSLAGCMLWRRTIYDVSNQEEHFSRRATPCSSSSRQQETTQTESSRELPHRAERRARSIFARTANGATTDCRWPTPTATPPQLQMKREDDSLRPLKFSRPKKEEKNRLQSRRKLSGKITATYPEICLFPYQRSSAPWQRPSSLEEALAASQHGPVPGTRTRSTAIRPR